ncbi:MAG: exonuclease domain-containing protein [Pseudonocardiaceae bacterium]
MNNAITSWRDGPILAVDLETTNVDPHRDRIVTATAVTIRPRPGERPEVTTRTWLANPGVDIPADATAIHGITTEQARREGQPAADVAAEVTAWLGEVWTATTPLCAFHTPFDLTMLNAELHRYHGRSLPLSGPVIDPAVIDRHLDPHRSGTRHLCDVCRHYQVPMGKAHDAEQDALAAARLAWWLAKVEPARVGSLAPHKLHSQQARWFREQELAYADQLDRRIRLLEAKGGNAERIERLISHATYARATAPHWPLLPESTSGTQPTRRRIPPRPGGPTNSHASWTLDQETALRDEWLAADPSAVTEAIRANIAVRYGRSPVAIRSRLLRLRCDPELPGHACDDDRAAHLKRIYDAEYSRNQH